MKRNYEGRSSKRYVLISTAPFLTLRTYAQGIAPIVSISTILSCNLKWKWLQSSENSDIIIFIVDKSGSSHPCTEVIVALIFVVIEFVVIIMLLKRRKTDYKHFPENTKWSQITSNSNPPHDTLIMMSQNEVNEI